MCSLTRSQQDRSQTGGGGRRQKEANVTGVGFDIKFPSYVEMVTE